MLAMQPTLHFPNITCAHSCHCSHYKNMAIIFYNSLLVAQFIFLPFGPLPKISPHLPFAPITSHVTSTKGQATYPIAPKQV